jgi:hypothetical protein
MCVRWCDGVTFVVQPLINSDSACATVCVRVRPLNHKPKPKPKESAHPCPLGAVSNVQSAGITVDPKMLAFVRPTV